MAQDVQLTELIEKFDRHIDSDNQYIIKSTELLGRLDERGAVMADQVERITHTLLDGNGSPALTVTVARIDERLQKLESTSEKKKLSGGDRALIYTTAIGGFFTLLDMVIRHLK